MGIDDQGVLTTGGPAGVVAVEQPAAGIDRLPLMLHALGHVDAVGDAVGVGQDQRRAVIGLGFDERPQGVLIAGAHGHAGHVDVAIGHRDQSEVLLGAGLAIAGELRHRSPGRGLRHLSAGVGVHLRIQHQDVDVVMGGEEVIDAAEADVVGPAITADHPDTAFHQVIGQAEQAADRYQGFVGVPGAWG